MTCETTSVVFKTLWEVIGHGIKQYISSLFSITVNDSDGQDIIYHEHADNDSAMFVPIVLGSDKTTVSVATGQHDYYPLYLSISNLHNSAR